LGKNKHGKLVFACFQQLYQILMVQNNSLKTNDGEQGVDHFGVSSNLPRQQISPLCM
jgi:hypothetical protein